MERILYDILYKQEKPIWDLDPENHRNQEFNRKIVAVNSMYAWLYAQGILQSVSFEMRDYTDMTFFALDTDAVLPYRERMAQSGVPDAELAIRHIFDETYAPCEYSGAFQIGWTMSSYRDFDGTVSRSWECGLIKHLDSPTVLDVLDIQEKRGVKAAISAAFDFYGFEPSDIKEGKQYA